MRDAMSESIFESNLEILETAYDLVENDRDTDAHDVTVPEGDHDDTPLLMSGSDAIAYGSIDEGCRFISGYPMTPWTEVFTIMSQNLPELGGISEQVEDEIAAAALALGASHAGAKAMSGSSGGGFALMSEPLGLAEMTETPVVLIEAMRAGPSTGMPTKPEQADLEHVLYTSQGDSHRVVLAPGTVEEAYEQTRTAFRLAYEYQIPSILLYDQKLGGELVSVPKSHFDREPNPGLGATLDEMLSKRRHTAALASSNGTPTAARTASVPGRFPARRAGVSWRQATNTTKSDTLAKTRTTVSRRSTAGWRSSKPSEPTSTPRVTSRTTARRRPITASLRSAASKGVSKRRPTDSLTRATVSARSVCRTWRRSHETRSPSSSAESTRCSSSR
jgi:Pyruvate:ferredoxin oxidoreductase and related 2-oxoacid:ferredoxin oxidoreductases, alpha subunit